MTLTTREAVILAAGQHRSDAVFEAARAPAMIPLVDRPLLQHVVESLIDQGVRRFHLVLSSHAEAVERHFQDGARWGCTFAYHLASDPAHAWKVLSRIPLEDGQTSVVLANGEMLPKISWPDLSEPLPVAITHRSEWTGWAVLSGTCLHALAAFDEWTGVSRHVLDGARTEGSIFEAPAALSTATAQAVIDSQSLLLNGAFPEIDLWGRETQPGVRLRRHAHVSASAQFVPPVFIGCDSMIGARVRLGPNVVLGDECVIEPETSIKDALILDGTFVGERLMLDRVLIDQGRLHHVRLETEFTVPDDLVLDSVHHRWWRRHVRSAAARLAALALLILFLPVLTGMWLVAVRRRERPLLHRRPFVKLPVREGGVYREVLNLTPFTAASPERLGFVEHFLLYFLPGLPHVMAGRLHLAGVPPRTCHQIAALAQDWREAYLTANAGLVTEAYIDFDHPADPLEQKASEIYFAKFSTIRDDFRLLFRYFVQVARHFGRNLTGHHTPVAPAV